MLCWTETLLTLQILLQPSPPTNTFSSRVTERCWLSYYQSDGETDGDRWTHRPSEEYLAFFNNKKVLWPESLKKSFHEWSLRVRRPANKCEADHQEYSKEVSQSQRLNNVKWRRWRMDLPPFQTKVFCSCCCFCWLLWAEQEKPWRQVWSVSQSQLSGAYKMSCWASLQTAKLFSGQFQFNRPVHPLSSIRP